MKITRILLTLTLVLTMAMSLASCEVIDANVQGLIDEATAQLNQTIESLEATKTELENAKATLEKAKTELEAAKSALEGEKAALEDKIEGLLNCVEGEHDMKLTPNGDGTHTEACLYCEYSKTQNCTFLDYVDNGDGSYTATCPTCGNTHTSDSSVLYVVVMTEAELNDAVKTDGARIRLGSDIDLSGYIIISNTVEIDLAGHSVSTNDPSINEFFVYGTLYIYDSVGGGSVENGFNTYEDTYLKIGTIGLAYQAAFGTEGTIDLSEYRGGEIMIYAGFFTDIILGEGYCFYYETVDDVIPDFEGAKEAGWVRIVPTD